MTVSPQAGHPPIRIEVGGARAGIDLADALGRRGLVGRLVHREGRWEVELISAYEQTESLLAEVIHAVEEWSTDRDHRDVHVRVGDTIHTASNAAVV
jgi:hypothetical protein